MEEVDAAEPIFQEAAITTAFVTNGFQGAQQHANDIYSNVHVVCNDDSDDDD